MPLATGTRMGPYEVIAALGAGGMGEVYRARDTRLGREVAIKMLGSRFQARTDGRERLLQEARAVSALNHPNILALYDICSENGNEFLVMELVRGRTLDQLIGNRGIGVNEAVKYAIPLADALARAHAAGILHRDLKPSNIMISEDGAPKILDFGLAQAAEQENRSDGDETRSLTAEKVVADTAGYMSPEQAEGKKLDARSDIFSFGAVLYEMITGRRAFRGDSTASTLAAVLRQEPEPPTRITPQVPKELERIIQRCLRKDPNRRFHSMNDVKVELEEVREESESGLQAAIQAPARRRRTWMYAAACIVLLAIAAAIWWWRMQRMPPPPPSQPVPLSAYEGDEDFPDFSPDASQVVFAWNGASRGKYHIFVKPVGSPNYLQLTKGDAEEKYPKWSPDGQWIAFQRQDNTGQHTFLVSPIGGNERKLHDGSCLGLSWSSDSKSLACGAESGLVLISAENGSSRQLTSAPKGEVDVSPAFSPDGRDLLFIEGRPEGSNCDLYLLELNRDLSPRAAPRRITNEHASELGGGAGLAWTADGREAIWSMSNSAERSRLFRVAVWRNGAVEPLSFAGQGVFSPAITRHQSRLAYSRSFLDIDIWRANGHSTERDPVSSTEAEFNPQFSPDGKRIAFQSNRSGSAEIWVANSDGTNPVQLTNFKALCGSPRWSPGGQWIAFDSYGVSGLWQVWIVSSNGGAPRRVTDGRGSSKIPSFSHDGKWAYFADDRTGRDEIFRVSSGGGAAMQVTHSGGTVPQESADGQTIYYLTRSTKGSAALYATPFSGEHERPLGVDVFSRSFQVTADGIYFIAPTGKDRPGPQIRFYDFATRHSRLIQALGDVNLFSGLTVSPDRKTFLYSVQQDNGLNLMLVDNFR